MSKESGSQSRFDAVVVGAGMAGACAAFRLAQLGLAVALVDREARCAPCFKAEKVEPDQAERLRELGLFDVVRPTLTPIPSIASGHAGRVLAVAEIEQYGVDYWDLVNAVRAAMPAAVETRIARVEQIELADDRPRVSLADGSVLEGRIVVLASGTSPALASGLGLRYRDVRRPHSLAFGFDVEPECPPTQWASLTYSGEQVESRLDYLTLFPIGARWRANLFTYIEPAGATMRAILRSPTEAIAAGFPRLERLVGRVAARGRVEAQKIDLYQQESPPRSGLVTLGDAYQSVCPATGTGLSKVLTDVVALCDHLPRWLATPGMGAEKIATYYADARKRTTDQQSLDWAEHRRNFATRTDLRWRIHRARSRFETWLDGRRRARRRPGAL